VVEGVPQTIFVKANYSMEVRGVYDQHVLCDQQVLWRKLRTC
jgi:hypothetical protein